MTEGTGVRHRVEGSVNFENLMSLRREGEAVIGSAPGAVEMELVGLDGGNSAAVALLMGWFRAAQRLDKSITFLNVPEDVRKIIELSGLTDVLPLAPPAGSGMSGADSLAEAPAPGDS